MTVHPLGLAALCVFFVFTLRGLKYGLWAAMAFLPMGAFAVIALGNFNLLALHAAFLSLIGLRVGSAVFGSQTQIKTKVETPVLILGILTIYVVVMSQILPRIFAGDVMVFSLQNAVDGSHISPLLQSQISVLSPSSGNISQPVYFTLSAIIFIFTLALARSEGADKLDKAVFISAGINALLGLMDFIGLDNILLLLKTAEYSIFLNTKIAGLSRIVGAFPEASAMGSFSAAMFAYMIIRYFDTGRLWALWLALANALWAVLALSSTGFVALGIASLFIALRLVFKTGFAPIPRDQGVRILFVSLLSVIIISLLLLLTNFSTQIQIFLDELIFNKATTLSGLERRAWAERGLKIGWETYGLGTGLGSTRSNGLIAVLVSNIGIPGLLLYSSFLWTIFRQHRSGAKDSGPSFYEAGLAGLVTVLAGALVSGTTADPGILFMIFAALIVASNPPHYITFKAS